MVFCRIFYLKDPILFLPPKKLQAAQRLKLLPFLQKSKKLRIKGYKTDVELINSLYFSQYNFY